MAAAAVAAPVAVPAARRCRTSRGTCAAYRRTGGSAESGHHVDRQRTQWSPAPPSSFERLTLRATDADGTVVFDAEIPVPRSAV